MRVRRRVFGVATQFDLWDADKNGKVYPKEISGLYKRQRAPYNTQVRGTASSDANALFRALDLSGEVKGSKWQVLTPRKQPKSTVRFTATYPQNQH